MAFVFAIVIALYVLAGEVEEDRDRLTTDA